MVAMETSIFVFLRARRRCIYLIGEVAMGTV